jgi:hypothetical protein
MAKFCTALLAIITLVVAGCGTSGPPMGQVTGTVTLDGKPMPNRMVVFVPKAGGQTSTATTNSEGRYELIGASTKGALIGLHTVSITSVREAAAAAVDMSQMPSDSPQYAAQGDPAAYKKVAEFKEVIPARYNTKTELVEEVKAGKNTIDFDLKSK